VEIKCQLDATDEFLLQILLLAQHVSGTIMPIIRSSRILYKWLLSVVCGAWFSSCRYGVELRVVCPVCGLQPYVEHSVYCKAMLKQGDSCVVDITVGNDFLGLCDKKKFLSIWALL
jgi:hypothetical protein